VPHLASFKMQVVGYKDKKQKNEFDDRMQELADLG
jgi:hypothetical protein